MLRDRSRDGIEMACVEECRAVPQLHRAIATRSRASSPTAQKIDVPLTGEVEGMPIADALGLCAPRHGDHPFGPGLWRHRFPTQEDPAAIRCDLDRLS